MSFFYFLHSLYFNVHGRSTDGTRQTIKKQNMKKSLKEGSTHVDRTGCLRGLHFITKTCKED